MHLVLVLCAIERVDLEADDTCLEEAVRRGTRHEGEREGCGLHRVDVAENIERAEEEHGPDGERQYEQDEKVADEVLVPRRLLLANYLAQVVQRVALGLVQVCLNLRQLDPLIDIERSPRIGPINDCSQLEYERDVVVAKKDQLG